LLAVTSILGIDAAWTLHKPSGVALVRNVSGTWECIGLAPSYNAFIDLGKGVNVDWTEVPKGSPPDVTQLLDASTLLCGERVDVISVDMPLSTDRIDGRREADDQVSREFGSRKCATHSPSRERHGELSDQLRRDFEAQGYPLATKTTPLGAAHALIEVYPHPALLSLCPSKDRLMYKTSRTRSYWPELSLAERRLKLLEEWQRILAALRKNISRIPLDLPDSATLTLSALKRYEDALDALVCCWIGGEYLVGKATPFGDAAAAIWIPEL